MRQASRFAIQRGWRLVFADVGIDPASVLVLAGLPADLFVRPGASLTAPEYFRFWHGIEAAAGDMNIPLRLGRAISTEAFDPAIFASLCSPDLNVALLRIARFKRLIGPLAMTVKAAARHTDAGFACYGHDAPLPRNLIAFEFVFLTQLARLATRREVRPVACTVADLPPRPSDYEEFLGCALRQGSANLIRFSAEDARRPFLTENAPMWNAFEPKLRAQLSKLDTTAGMTERVRAVLLDMLPSGRCTAETVARRLGVSKRSLQRRLEEEGTAFHALLSRIRRELAEHYLLRSDLPLGEIGYLLGFEDTNSFLRSFKRWTGSTAGQVRARGYGGSKDETAERPRQPSPGGPGDVSRV